MKKKLAFILALAAMASTSATAFADTNTGNAPTSIDVNGKYVAGDARSVISVDVTWDNMDFTYTAPSKGDWNAKTHEYENSVEGSWSADNGTDPKITVSNHSNIPIKTNLDFVSDVEGVNGSFSKNSFTLDSAVGTEYEQAPKDETSFTVSGSGIDKDEKLGTITVTVEENDTDAAYKVSEEVFSSQMENVDSFKAVVSGDSDDAGTYYFDGTKYSFKHGKTSWIGDYDGTNYYSYSQTEGDSDWTREIITKNEYDEAILMYSNLPRLKDKFANFAYDAATHSYKSTGAFKIPMLWVYTLEVSEAAVQFENDKLKGATIAFEGGSMTYSDIGTTKVEIPLNAYEDTWSYDENYHWHACTSDIDDSKDHGSHTYSNGTCDVCGYTPSGD